MKKQKYQVYQEPAFNKIIIPKKVCENVKKAINYRQRTIKREFSQHKKIQIMEEKYQIQEFVNIDLQRQDKTKYQHKKRFALSNGFNKEIYYQRVNDIILNRNKKSKKKPLQLLSMQNQNIRCSKITKTSLALPRKETQSFKVKNISDSPYTKNQSDMLKLGDSPYIKNQSELLKLIKMLKPVKGPTQSIKNQILKHNDSNKKNHEIVLLRSSYQNFQIKRQKYLQRIGLKTNSKVFVMNSRDQHIRQALIKRGWTQLHDISDSFFHLKWFYSDSSNDYKNLNAGQLFNHFYHNQELTNKNNLRKNIKNALTQNQPLAPLTFDLGISSQFKKFSQTATFFQAFKILGMIINELKQKDPYFKRIVSNPNHFKFHNKKSQGSKLSNYLLTLGLFTFQNKPADQRIQMLISNIFELMSFLISYLQQQGQIRYSLFHSQNRQKKSFNIYSTFQYFQNKFQQAGAGLLSKLPTFLKVQLVKLNYRFQNQKGLYEGSYGRQNTWIIKPTGVSRGTGIYVQSDYTKLLSQANNQHGRIVQKYIQKPFLLKDHRKVDLRQWVLVRTFQPLEAYVYKNLYGRICSQIYTQTDFQNIHKHLTNYSLSKQFYNLKKETVSHVQEQDSSLFVRTGSNKFQPSIILQEHLKEQIQQRNTDNQNTWQQVKLRIKQNIVKTLKACSNNIQENPNCFQVYGFDILLDQSLNVFIIQVNLSPACEKRQGLQLYLQQMSQGLAQHIEEWNDASSPINHNSYKTSQKSYRTSQKQLVWQRLQENVIQVQLRQINESKLKLQKVKIIQNWVRSDVLRCSSIKQM